MSDPRDHVIESEDFEYVRRFLHRQTGLSLTPEKKYLVETRLAPLARQLGLPTVAAVIIALRGHQHAEVARQVIDAMMTNETLFFRDKLMFDLVTQQVLPDLIAVRAAQKRLRIWCAAASTGQEPYSLAMHLLDSGLIREGWSIEILATDISADALDRARRGTYSQFEVQRGLPIQSLLKHFSQAANVWLINQTVKDIVRFEQLNLLDDFSRLGQFDLILCRNVLIYFDTPTKMGVLDRLAPMLQRDGLLMLGAAESVIGLTSRLVPDRHYRGLYARSDGLPLRRDLSGSPASFSRAV